MDKTKCAICGKKISEYNSTVIESGKKEYTVCINCKEKMEDLDDNRNK